MPKKRSFLKSCLFALVPLVVLAGLTEAGFRLFWQPPPGKPAPRFRILTPDPDLIWRLAETDHPDHKTNELGFRDLPYNEHADVKILLLGDSVSWGDQVDQTERVYPQVLERLLNLPGSPLSYEVINAGVPGYSTFQEKRFLEIRGLDLKPDIILLQFCLNDVVERYRNLAGFGGDRTFLGIDTRSAVPGVQGFLLRHSRFFEALTRYLQKKARRGQELSVEAMTGDSKNPVLDGAWKRVLEEIGGIRQIARGKGIPFYMVIMPYRFQLADPKGLRAPQDRLMAYARTEGIPALDLLPTFADYFRARPRVALFMDANHLSPAGHQLAALALKAFLEQASLSAK